MIALCISRRNTQRYSKKIKINEVEVGIGSPVILVFETNSSRDRVMRGLGYGLHMERSVVSFRLTY